MAPPETLNQFTSVHYLLFYDVVDDYATRRAAFRPAHLEHAARAVERGELILGGALADPIDRAVLLFRGPSPAAARLFAETDPYVLNGIVKRWQIREWTTVAGDASVLPPAALLPRTTETAALFRRLSTGVYVIGVAHADRRNGFTAAWVMQTSFDPLLVALSINREHASHALLQHGGGFTVNVLKKGQLELARRFGTRTGRDSDKLAGIAWRSGTTGAPVLLESLAYLECQCVQRVSAGDHDIAIGQVIDGRILFPEDLPLTYAETGDLDGSAALYPPSLTRPE